MPKFKVGDRVKGTPNAYSEFFKGLTFTIVSVREGTQYLYEAQADPGQTIPAMKGIGERSLDTQDTWPFEDDELVLNEEEN